MTAQEAIKTLEYIAALLVDEDVHPQVAEIIEAIEKLEAENARMKDYLRKLGHGEEWE